jgi:hypothetical protein
MIHKFILFFLYTHTTLLFGTFAQQLVRTQVFKRSSRGEADKFVVRRKYYVLIKPADLL